MTGKRIVPLFCLMALLLAVPAFAGSGVIAINGGVERVAPDALPVGNLVSPDASAARTEPYELDWDARMKITEDEESTENLTTLVAGQEYIFWIRFNRLGRLGAPFMDELVGHIIEATFTLSGANGAPPVMQFANGQDVFRKKIRKIHRSLYGMGVEVVIPANTLPGQMVLNGKVTVLDDDGSFVDEENTASMNFQIVRP